jgi:hypothetical protein
MFRSTQPKWARLDRPVFLLKHLETGEYVCLRRDGREYLAAFTEPDSAARFQDEMQLIEFVDILAMPLADAPFDYFWLDGVAFGRPSTRQVPQRLAA